MVVVCSLPTTTMLLFRPSFVGEVGGIVCEAILLSDVVGVSCCGVDARVEPPSARTEELRLAKHPIT